jgi:hypothetical protein
MHCVSGVEEGWLASDKFHGKSVKVRLLGPDPNHNGHLVAAKKVPKGSLAFTTGQPVSGELKAIELRVITPGSQPMLVPLQYLAPVKPRRPEGRAIVIAGDHFGKEVLVMRVDELGGAEWSVLLLDRSRMFELVSPDHLVEVKKRPPS